MRMLPAALGLGDGGDEAVGRVGGHGAGEVGGEALDAVPAGRGAERRHHVQPLAAGGLDEGGEARGLEPGAHLAGGGDDLRPGHALARVEVHHDLVGALEVVERGLPGVDLERAALHQADQPGQAVDGEEQRVAVVLGVVEGQDLAALALPGVLLEEALALDAARAAQSATGRLTRCGAMRRQTSA